MIEYSYKEAVMLRDDPDLPQRDENRDSRLSPEQIIVRTIRANCFGDKDYWHTLYKLTFIDPLNRVPLHINDDGIMSIVARWRMKIAR